ncbi:MAG: ABC transporter permease [Glaciecola sp.]|jgi:putative ABC transport system permease protein|uniref:ABC transporter permease n=1 Tax=Glaciecola sp. HTCC2999 TaxID=455436 RepID=UPI0000E0E49A|nr:FtsX-like permease family protein [Glaciecola sp. HTCC2999]
MSAMPRQLAWRLFKHEAKRGELSIILFAIILSVAAVLSLSLFSERLQGALTDRSAEFIAADRQLSARAPLDPEWISAAHTYNLATALQTSTRSMAFANDELALVDLRAVSEDYPLKGTIKLAPELFATGVATDHIPASGEAWMDSRLFQLLGVSLGDKIELGEAQFTITQVLSEIPDGGFSVFNADPMVLINLSDIAATKVTGPGSRVNYKVYFTGDDNDLDNYFDELSPQLDRQVHRWLSVQDDTSPIGESVARAEQFFLLASLLAIVLAAVAIGVAAQRYAQRHFDPVAIMKTLGASTATIRKVYLYQIVFIALLGIVIGAIVGFVLQQLVVSALADTVEVSLQVWYWRPLLIAIFTGSVCALLFCLYPLLGLFSIPPLRVLRRDIASSFSARGGQYLTAGGAILLLMWVYSQNLKISLILFVSGLILVGLLLAATFGLIALGRVLGTGRMGAWQLAWARIKRRSLDNSVQLISFALTIMLLLVVLVMRNDIVQQWRDQLPTGTANYFLANVTEEQRPNLVQHFADNGIETDGLYPVSRGRFVKINDEILRNDITKEEEDTTNETRRGMGREANLTWDTTLQMGNEVIAGQWHGEWTPETSELGDGIYPVSIEERVGKRMRIGMGDQLTFNIGSEIVTVEVTSIRTVNWQTMQPNFFFVLHPMAMEAFRASYITSFYLPPERKPELTRLMAPFASVTMFDVDARINQVRSIIDQVSAAIEFILILVLVAGSLVLIAQVQASMDERQRELAILRTLGAKGRMIRASVIYEFLIIGSVAGFMAALANEVSLYLLQTQIFQMQSSLHIEYWVIAPLTGAVVVGLLGAASCWRLLSMNTQVLLRKML